MVGIISLPFSRNELRQSLERANQMLKKVAKALEGLQELSELVPKKSLLKNGLQSMIEHLEAADSLGRTCNFKFGSAESEITEDVPLPRDDSIVTGHSRKRSLPTEKGCEPSPKKAKTDTATTESSTTVTTTSTTTTTMATAPSQTNTTSQAGVASTSTADTSTQSAPKVAHRKSTKTSSFTVRLWESV